jgi:hypothetical protein
MTPKPSMKFVVAPKAVIAMRAGGFSPPAGHAVPACAFEVGDFVNFPATTNVVFRVVGRWYQMDPDGTGQWQVMLGPSEHPSKLPEMQD